jgi:hypothetical protein
MNCNVFIKHYSGGYLVGEQAKHNVWTRFGEQYLAEMVGALGFGGVPSAPLPSDPVFPERDERIKYMGLGVGSAKQTTPLVDVAPISTSYPVGYADEVYAPDYLVVGQTNGKQYDSDNPTAPLIGTLERPVRVSGGTNPYNTAPGSDIWRIGPPALFLTHQSSQDVTVHATVDVLNNNDVAYPPFNLGVPVTEAGLFTDVAGTSPAYVPLLAYVSFATIMLDADDIVEFIWQVRFG